MLLITAIFSTIGQFIKRVSLRFKAIHAGTPKLWTDRAFQRKTAHALEVIGPREVRDTFVHKRIFDDGGVAVASMAFFFVKVKS